MFARVLGLSIAATVVTLSAQLSYAAADSPGQSRAEVKGATRAALRSGQLTPPGEATRVQRPDVTASTRSRSDRKAETLQARKAGELRPAGMEPEWKAARRDARKPSTLTRADRKAATLAAAAQGKLVPAGEGSDIRRK